MSNPRGPPAPLTAGCVLSICRHAVCRKWSGELHGAEGQRVAWVTARQLRNYAMPAADIPLVPAILEALAGDVQKLR